MRIVIDKNARFKKSITVGNRTDKTKPNPLPQPRLPQNPHHALRISGRLAPHMVIKRHCHGP
jgi:hypothetical protein